MVPEEVPAAPRRRTRKAVATVEAVAEPVAESSEVAVEDAPKAPRRRTRKTAASAADAS